MSVFLPGMVVPFFEQEDDTVGKWTFTWRVVVNEERVNEFRSSRTFGSACDAKKAMREFCGIGEQQWNSYCL